MRNYRLQLTAFLSCAFLFLAQSIALSAKPTSLSPAPILISQTDQIKFFFEQGLQNVGSGKFQEAIDAFNQAFSLSKSPQQQAQILGNIAVIYHNTGQYSQALETNQKALDILTALEQPFAIGQVHSNLGNVYEALGQYDKAIDAYQSSIRIAQAENDQRAEGIAIGNLGYIYSLQGDQDTAIKFHEQGLAIAREIGDRASESFRLLNMGIAFHARQDIPSAIKFYEQSVETARAIEHSSLETNALTLEANALINLGIAVAETGDTEAALVHLEKSVDVLRALNQPEFVAMALNNLGHTLLTANQLDAAEARLRESVKTLDSLRSQELGDTYNVSIFDTQLYTYNLLTQILVENNQPEAALETSEAGRARAFSDLLRNRVSTVGDRTPAHTTATDTPSIEDIRKIAREQNATLVEYALVPEDTFRVQGRQRGATSELHIWVVKPDGDVKFHSQPIDTQSFQLKDLVRQMRNSLGRRQLLSRGSISVEPTKPLETSEKLKELHQLLIEPIKALLPEDPEQKVIFIPQEELFLVPFSALMYEEDGNEKYLIEDHTILTSPSIQALAFTRAQKEASSTTTREQAPLIIGNPEMPQIWEPNTEEMMQLSSLPGAEQEALAIANFFGVEALINSDASEQTVKDRIGSASIIHLATHGLLEYGNPKDTGLSDMPGAIALAPTDGVQDGFLTSAEILNDLSLSADLVVLSACDTGQGDITGDGVIGLARSFMAAGTPSIVVSLWDIPDTPTAELMVDFYTELSKGQDKAQALRQAMLLAIDKYPNPRDWAAFTLIGEAQ